MRIQTATNWATNGELIADVAELGHIGPRVIDLSYGLGKFWTHWQPQTLVKNDIAPMKGDYIPYGGVERINPIAWRVVAHVVAVARRTPQHCWYSPRLKRK